MRLIIYADIHKYGPQQMDVDIVSRSNAWYLGDNVDLKYCKPSELLNAIKERDSYKKTFGDRYISGNHELEHGDIHKIVKDEYKNNIMLTHGDYLLWSGGQAKSYRNSKPCSGFVKRLYKSFIYNVLDRYLTCPLMIWQKRRVTNYAKLHKCETIVMGHWHVNSLTEIIYNGVRIVMVPRGMTEIVV